MAWQIEFVPAAAKELDKLDPVTVRRLLKFLRERVSPLQDPRSLGEALRGDELGSFWKYRVGDYRIIADINDVEIVILVVRIGHRRFVYRRR